MWLLVKLDTGRIAESLMPLLTLLIGAVCVLFVTKVLMPVRPVTDQTSPIVLTVTQDGSLMVRTAVLHVTPSVPPAQVLLPLIVLLVKILTL